MNPGRFFIQNMGMTPIIRNGYMIPRNVGFFSRIGNGIKTFNWAGLLNGANKTLNVMNQTIPLINQAKPMFNNMRSMIQLAKAFGSETVSKNSNKKSIQSTNYNNNIKTDDNFKSKELATKKKETSNNNYPSFFI